MTYADRLQDFADRIDALAADRQVFLLIVLSKSLVPLFEIEGTAAGVWRTLLPEVLDRASEVALGHPAQQDAGVLLEELSARVPNADDLIELAEFYMLDAMVVIDGMLRAASDGGSASGALVEYALRPMHTYLCERDLGVLDIGSSIAEMEWEAQLETEPKMDAALQFVEFCISRAEDTTPLTVEDISDVSSRGGVLVPPAS